MPDTTDLLKRFRALVGTGLVERITCLTVAAQWTAYNRERYDVRKAQTSALPKVVGACWACVRVSAAHRHHIIALINGGTNDLANIVGLCRSCHEAIHPWMRPQRRRQEKIRYRERERVLAAFKWKLFTPDVSDYGAMARRLRARRDWS